MSTALYGNVPCEFAHAMPVTFIAADTTKAKIIVDAQPAAAAAGTQPLKFGGCTVIDGTLASSDSSSKAVQFSIGEVRTTQETTATGTISTTASTVVRVNGSWITDGIRVGVIIMLFAPLNLAENTGIDGIQGVVTAVTATTITVNGTPFAVSAGVAAGTRVCVVASDFRVAVPANSGHSTTAANVAFVEASTDAGAVPQEIKLGASQVLIANMVSAVSALPAQVHALATIARY